MLCCNEEHKLSIFVNLKLRRKKHASNNVGWLKPLKAYRIITALNPKAHKHCGLSPGLRENKHYYWVNCMLVLLGKTITHYFIKNTNKERA